MTRFATALCALDVSERDDIQFNFANDLAADESIDDATVEVHVLHAGRDPDAAALIDGGNRIGRLEEGEWIDDEAGAIVLQRVSAVGRPVGTSYSLRCTVRTSLDRELTAAGHIGIKRL